MQPGRIIQGRTVTADDIESIRTLIARHPGWHRTRLSQELCRRWDWVAANGRMKDMAARALLRKLHTEDLITLPAAVRSANNAFRHRSPAPVALAQTAINGPLSELTPLELVAVSDAPERRLFAGLLHRYHYLGYSGPVGENLGYLVYARPRPAPTPGSVLLIRDNSGSMAGNDPTNLRFTAARLFVALLDEGDAVGIILFSTESHPLTDSLVTIGSAAGKRDLVRRLEPAKADGWTDVKAAFADAQVMLGRADVAGRKTVVVFLTDGEPEIASPYPEYEGEALALARSLGVPILAIALTPAAQTPFLSRLVSETGGAVVPADDATDLLDAYLEAFGQIKDRTVLRPEASGLPKVALLRIEPALAPYVETVSFIISKPESVTARLVGPDGQGVQPADPGVTFSLTEDPRFAVLTVAHPPGGVWGFRLEGAGSVEVRAILRSRLRVEVVAPGRFHEAGQPMPIEVHLIEEPAGGSVGNVNGVASFSVASMGPEGGSGRRDRLREV